MTLPEPPLAPSGRDVSVAIVEDDPRTRRRFEHALARADRLWLAYSAGTVGEMVAWLRDNRVDVLLVDLGLPDGSGLQVISHCRKLSPGTEIMVISMFGDEANMMRAFEAGARGYLLKDGTEDDLADHVLSLNAGGSPMTPIIARQLLTRLSPAPAMTSALPVDATLTARERDILAKLARGYTYAETAEILGISPSTVQSHVKNIYSKLAVHSKTEAIHEARQLGLL
ncbi:MAG: DNA-binding response regulator [Burkholderiales bacterium RIFCSPHIGHO2_01_FULL_64_960]|uniref:response regulator transcription factor n=1 Tax=unclassified Acidovorax TaxID=2684926 RepID=UPI0008BDB3A2|nr:MULTISPECIES: response regulator transcription factor [unclassified Acidovorax]MBV7462220.1 response regulator transcription factor [Acidovorax sp. sif0632]MBV7467061.1 response regulator transcription factor [Acidovorax sp. sif0613]OGA62037.1 MAG: DNA-binding response regulator [Burkholderiales bacterium RIFCSPHIGHO2_01_FULL_64_960]